MTPPDAKTPEYSSRDARLSPAAFFADFYLYPTASILFLAAAIYLEPRHWFEWVATTIISFLVWTFVEYLLHRFVLHHVKWVKDQHDVHHHDEKALVGTPTWFSFLVFLAFVSAPALLVTASIPAACCISSGMMAGYLWYVVAHYGIHHWRIRENGYLARLKRRHALHHRYDDLGNFGVTTGFWDYVFQTNVHPKRRDSSHA